MGWFDGCRVAYGMADGIARGMGHVKASDLGEPLWGVRNASCRSITSPALKLPRLCQAGECAPNSRSPLAYESLGH